jgi:hypothetical protein
LSHNQLPEFSFITPNLIDDMRNGTVADGAGSGRRHHVCAGHNRPSRS